MFLLVPAHPGSPGQRAIKWLCVLLTSCARIGFYFSYFLFSTNFFRLVEVGMLYQIFCD